MLKPVLFDKISGWITPFSDQPTDPRSKKKRSFWPWPIHNGLHVAVASDPRNISSFHRGRQVELLVDTQVAEPPGMRRTADPRWFTPGPEASYIYPRSKNPWFREGWKN
jgi:hypothetical protein